MAFKLIYFIPTLLLITSTLAAVPVETQSTNKDEFVYVQTLKSGARPISRKEKATLDERPFETSHKLPLSVTYLLNQQEDEEKNLRQKRGAPAPAPAGSIKIDPLKLIQKYKSELKVNPTTAPKTPKPTTFPKRGRIKKEADPEPLPTSPRPSLTSGAPPTPRNLDIDAVPQATGDKQRSRIQIKKGPNGQEYEYEYVYYYYDEDDNKSTTQKVFNSHDGPARHASNTSKEKTYTKEAASNEVIPNARGRNRGRQLEEEEAVGEERLPPSTRFPPRSRNFASTSTSEEENKATTSGKERGRPTTVANIEAIPEESQNHGRTRSSIRRGSLDLIDNESFNTHSGNPTSEQSSNGPSFPSDLPSGPVRFLGATPNERVNLQDQTPEFVTEQVTDNGDLTSLVGDTTTITISPMDKVALDLYAILQGTQKLSGEEDTKDNDTSGAATTTYQTETTEIPTTEYVTITTTTTTTTTTTPAPTTTTTTEAPAFGRGRFRGSANRKKIGGTTSSPSTEASHTETKPKSRFSRPSFGRPKSGTRTTSEPAHEQKIEAEEAKPLSKSRPTSRARFGSSRVKPSSTESGEEASSAPSKPAFSRPRPGFNSRNRGRTTVASPTAEERVSVSEEAESVSSTTARSKLRISGNNNVRPLRPGLRINLRGQIGGSTTTATEASLHETSQEDAKSEDSKEEAPSPAPAQDKNPLHRLRSRNRLTPTAAPKQKPAASATVQVRRVNPLIGRRRIGSTEATSTEAPVEAEPTEPTVSQENDNTETPAPSSSTTEEPKGLNKLLAGRRKIIAKHAHQ